MCVSAKIEEIQYVLLGYEFQKSGYNKYNHVHYHELVDIMPPIVNECHKRDLVLLFNFTAELGTLTVADKHDVSNCCKFTMPMPKETSLPTMNGIQSIGAFATYLKRYLLSNTFLILEADVADALEPKEEPKATAENKDTPIIKEKSRPKIPKPVNDALIKLDAEGKDINSRTVWAAIDKSAFEGNTDLKKECMSYVSAHIGKGGK